MLWKWYVNDVRRCNGQFAWPRAPRKRGRSRSINFIRHNPDMATHPNSGPRPLFHVKSALLKPSLGHIARRHVPSAGSVRLRISGPSLAASLDPERWKGFSVRQLP